MNDLQRAALLRQRQLYRDGCKQTSGELLDRCLPVRKRTAHKGDFGRVLIVSGSVGYTGAPVLAAKAALRSGAGLIFVGVPEPVYPIVAQKLDEPMVFPLPAEAGGLSEAALEPILQRLSGMDACLVGPGLGRGAGVGAVVFGILKSAKCPVILDADGINALEGHTDILRQAQAPVILTPHDGEFRRLGCDPSDRYAEAKRFAREYGVTVLLKGHRTLVVSPDKVWLNVTGNPGMATGGSGDVLAGVLLSLLGQGVEPTDAAAAAAWLHGAAGDFCAEATGEYGLTPSDMIAALPIFLK